MGAQLIWPSHLILGLIAHNEQLSGECYLLNPEFATEQILVLEGSSTGDFHNFPRLELLRPDEVLLNEVHTSLNVLGLKLKDKKENT